MTWTAPKTWVSTNVLTADELNTYLRDNLLQMSPAKAATIGSFFVTSAMNEVSERTPQSAFVATAESVTASASTSYADLITVGPRVTVQTTSYALVFLYCHMYNDQGTGSWMSYDVSTPSANAAADDRAILLQNTGGQRAGSMILHSNLTPGMNTFTAKYRISVSGAVATTGTWSDRRIAVLPF